MTTQTITALTEHIREVALTRSANSRKELSQLADAFEAQAAELLTALGRIAVGSKSVLRNDAMTEPQLRTALEVCIALAEAAIGMQVQPKMDS
jgi:hypothetical protein